MNANHIEDNNFNRRCTQKRGMNRQIYTNKDRNENLNRR